MSLYGKRVDNASQSELHYEMSSRDIHFVTCSTVTEMVQGLIAEKPQYAPYLKSVKKVWQLMVAFAKMQRDGIGTFHGSDYGSYSSETWFPCFGFTDANDYTGASLEWCEGHFHPEHTAEDKPVAVSYRFVK